MFCFVLFFFEGWGGGGGGGGPNLQFQTKFKVNKSTEDIADLTKHGFMDRVFPSCTDGSVCRFFHESQQQTVVVYRCCIGFRIRSVHDPLCCEITGNAGEFSDIT